MRNFAVLSAILVSFLAVSQCGVINEPLDDVAPYSLIDPIIKAILESMRPKLANITIDPINETIRNPDLNATILVNNIAILNADKFVIKSLKSSVVPLKLTNLTLTWNQINARAAYDLNGNVTLPPNRNPINLYAKGKATANLNKIFFTIGANVELKNNSIQIKPKGLFGFDLSVGSANVTLSSVMGSPDLGNAVSVFLSNIISDLVNTLKKPIFDAFQDDIIKFVNQILKNNGTTHYMDEQPAMPGLPLEGLESLDLSEELTQALNFQKFELDSEF